MTFLSGLGIVLSLVFGCLLLALVAELYYLLWWKQQVITSSNSNVASNGFQQNYSNQTKEMLYLFCCSTHNSTTITANTPAVNQTTNPDLEMGLESNNKDLLWKSLGEEGVESELMRLHNLGGPPRFLFTIKEETKEDLESEDGNNKSKRGERRSSSSKSKSLGELIAAFESHTPFLSPVASPVNTGFMSPYRQFSSNSSNCNYNNPLFESSREAEMFRLRSCSPPPKFKFLRDAEEKLCRRLLEESQKGLSDFEEQKDCSLHCHSQVSDRKQPSLP